MSTLKQLIEATLAAEETIETMTATLQPDPNEVEGLREELTQDISLRRDEKMIGYMRFIQSLEARIAAAGKEKKRQESIIKNAERTLEFLENTLMWALEQLGQDAYTTNYGTIASIPTGGKAILLMPDHNPDWVDSLPDSLKRITVEPNKIEIRKYIQAGNTLDGASIVPNDKKHIRITLPR